MQRRSLRHEGTRGNRTRSLSGMLRKYGRRRSAVVVAKQLCGSVNRTPWCHSPHAFTAKNVQASCRLPGVITVRRTASAGVSKRCSSSRETGQVERQNVLATATLPCHNGTGIVFNVHSVNVGIRCQVASGYGRRCNGDRAYRSLSLYRCGELVSVERHSATLVQCQ